MRRRRRRTTTTKGGRRLEEEKGRRIGGWEGRRVCRLRQQQHTNNESTR